MFSAKGTGNINRLSYYVRFCAMATSSTHLIPSKWMDLKSVHMLPERKKRQIIEVACRDFSFKSMLRHAAILDNGH